MTELADRNIYLSAGVHIGMRMKTKDMEPFIFKTRPDGLSVLDIEKTDERIKIVGKMLAGYKDILVVCRKANGFKPIGKFAEVVGGTAIKGRFPPGALTNPKFDGYFEPEIVILTDPVADRQALDEAIKKRIPVIAICDTYNSLEYIDLVIPGNNKGKKSLGLIYFLLAREVLKNRKEIKKDSDFKYKIEDFTEKD
ncbi:MAG: 30S ribosomal protein S2 [Candidatus Aenigmarchaeota archaeon]|nr:30S ribosomal protein S2 [Candidatus Aenigmarchaeota archaeon]